MMLARRAPVAPGRCRTLGMAHSATRQDRIVNPGGIYMIEGLLQPTHLLIILAVAVLVFGPKKLPDLGKGLAEGIKSFKEGVKDSDKPK